MGVATPLTGNGMTHHPESHRRSIRLKGYDYTQSGVYFLTVVVQDRLCLFGNVVDQEMRPNEAGEMVRRLWERLPDRFPCIQLDAFVVMPNHIHGILVIDSPVGALFVGTHRGAPNPTRATTRVAPTLGAVIGAYKSLTTRAYVKGVNAGPWPPFRKRLWQRNYYEHVVRNDASLAELRQYILNNPARWAFDRENPLAPR